LASTLSCKKILSFEGMVPDIGMECPSGYPSCCTVSQPHCVFGLPNSSASSVQGVVLIMHTS
jgi:hypothetical protein